MKSLQSGKIGKSPRQFVAHASLRAKKRSAKGSFRIRARRSCWTSRDPGSTQGTDIRDLPNRGGYRDIMTDYSDFSVVVKNRGRPPSSWKWGIYLAGRNSPIKQSEGFFSTIAEANRAGRKALSLFLSEYQDEMPQQWSFTPGRSKIGK